MKKYAVVIVSLFCSTLVFANNTQENTTQSEKIESIDCKPAKTIVKKTFIKKKKNNTNINKKPLVAELLTNKPIQEEKPVEHYISSNEIFHIPNNTKVEPYQIQSFSQPLKYSQISYKINQKNNYSELFLIDERTQNALDEHYLEKASFITTTNLDLVNLTFSQNVINYKNSNPILIPLENKNCGRYFVSYKLKDESKKYQYSNFLNTSDNENLKCLANIQKIIANSEYMSNNDFNLINVFLNSSELNNQRINFTLYISKDGETFFPQKSTAFAIKEDLSEFYVLPIKNKNQISGIEFSETVSKGKYIVVLNYEYNNERKTFRTLVNVN